MNPMGFEFDQNREDLKEFSCSICLLLCRTPVITNCMHIFCLGCLQTNQRLTNKCPNCRVTIISVTENKIIKNFIERQPTNCTCGWTGTVSSYMNHELTHRGPEPKIIPPAIDTDEDDYDALYYSFLLFLATLGLGALKII
ncbi:MAG: E3 ubiquitin-protein ligase RNF8-like [Hyperionvirus sp.]|uniref:E3 ubiquitin-protein ligase RNF8-like n=1 Tax=Hyperionvirus sp. TaxID=2487770 RepID=A0A3G5AB58_9VIRU|nr:MAG: E3 ubiquitin-protein ligase RNF8-like [Hyperionvirus sp.]